MKMMGVSMSNLAFIDEVEAIEYFFSKKNIYPINMSNYENMLAENVPERMTKSGKYYYEVKDE